jgi:hypothetical protein
MEGLENIGDSAARFLSYALERGMPAGMRLLAHMDGRASPRSSVDRKPGGPIDAVDAFFGKVLVEIAW